MTLLKRGASLRLGSLLAAVALNGCATIDLVQPWQRGTLALPEMTFDDDPLEKGFKEHIYSSKESSSGGLGVGGGGCGCN